MIKIKIEIEGLEILRKRAKAVGNSGHVLVPASWIGKRVAIVLLPEEENE